MESELEYLSEILSTTNDQEGLKFLIYYGIINNIVQVFVLFWLSLQDSDGGAGWFILTLFTLFALIGDLAVIALDVMQIEFLVETPWVHRYIMMGIFIAQTLVDAFASILLFWISLILCVT